MDKVEVDYKEMYKTACEKAESLRAERDEYWKERCEALAALAGRDKRIGGATSKLISLLAKTGGVEYRNRLESILSALGKEGS